MAPDPEIVTGPQDSDARLRSALRVSLDPFIVLDADGRIVEWNDGASRVFGWTRADAIGRPFPAVMLAAPFDAQYADALHLAAIGAPTSKLGVRHRTVARRQDGGAFPAELAIVPVPLETGLAFSVAVRDITEQERAALATGQAHADSRQLLGDADAARRALLNIIDDQRRTEDALRRTENELESRVRQRTAELEAANQELEAFSYSVSHDLRAPLRAIDGYARMLTEDYESVLDDEGCRRLTVIQKEARRMGILIDDLLRFSRLGRQTLERSPIDMTDLVREVVAELTRDLAPARSVDVEVGPLPPALGDVGVIRQVWVNVVGNALKFTATRTQARITIDGRTEGGMASYAVRDNGVGFDMRYAERLFGVFQRLHAATAFEGTGVGLALSRRIVTRHGGTIAAEGEVDCGATVTFTLPLAPVDMASATPGNTGALTA